jgi:hypothetical protein
LPKKLCLPPTLFKLGGRRASLFTTGSYPLKHSVLLNLWSVVFEKTALTRLTKGHNSFSFIWCPWSIVRRLSHVVVNFSHFNILLRIYSTKWNQT